MSGVSQMQRGIMRLALTVNVHTQGGTVSAKTGATVPGYRVPTVDYAGPKDLRPPLALWAIGGLQPSRFVSGFFEHTQQTRCIKASITRATTRLLQRGLLVYAPLPRVWPPDPALPDCGYVLTAEGLRAAGTKPMDLPLLAEACELFGITRQACYEPPCHAGPQFVGWGSHEQHKRKIELIEALCNGYRQGGAAPAVTEANGYRQEGAHTSVTDGATATAVPAENHGNHCEVQQ